VAVAFAVMAMMAVARMALSVVRPAVVTMMRSRSSERKQGEDQRGGDRKQRRRPPVPQMKVIHIGLLFVGDPPLTGEFSRRGASPSGATLRWLPGIAERKPTISKPLGMM
jgi:hypothetical protein